jgi:hypothetical protein
MPGFDGAVDHRIDPAFPKKFPHRFLIQEFQFLMAGGQDFIVALQPLCQVAPDKTRAPGYE